MRFREGDWVVYTEDETLGVYMPDGIVAGDRGAVMVSYEENGQEYVNVEFPQSPFGYVYDVDARLFKTPEEYAAQS